MALTREERLAALAHLERIRDEIMDASGWLGDHGIDRASISLQDAWHCMASALWDLQAPLRAQPSRPYSWLNGRT